MSARFFSIFVWIFVIVVVWALFFPSRRSSVSYQGSSPSYDVTVNTTNVEVGGEAVTAADGLDLQAVGALVAEAKNAEELERMLNDASRGINNLDLDEDGKVDYIRVEEFGSGDNRGFSLTTELAKDEVQEIATIEVAKTSDGKAKMQVHGNQHIYGSNHYYHHTYPSFGQILFMSWLFSPRPFYVSPYHYGVYPGYYRAYAPVPVATYRTRTSTLRSRSGLQKTGSSTIASTNRPKSPNAGKSANSVKAPLRNPTTSQKSFQARNPSKTAPRATGFGQNRTASTPRSTSTSRPAPRASTTARAAPSRSTPRNTSSSRSRSSFGGK